LKYVSIGGQPNAVCGPASRILKRSLTAARDRCRQTAAAFDPFGKNAAGSIPLLFKSENKKLELENF